MHHGLLSAPISSAAEHCITAEDFRDFTFTNAVRLWGTQNPKFFEATAVARAAAAVLAETSV